MSQKSIQAILDAGHLGFEFIHVVDDIKMPSWFKSSDSLTFSMTFIAAYNVLDVFLCPSFLTSFSLSIALDLLYPEKQI